jgi:thiamine kinase-like enzyme
LQTTIPDFHNLSLRYDQFLQAVQQAGKYRKKQAGELIAYLDDQKDIADIYKNIRQNPAFTLRVTHHDTKISNVLFDHQDKGLCVIDLDTVMSGYFISDIGDMLRTYLCPVTEEEKDFSKILIRENFFISIVKGYLSEMQHELSAEEKKYFVYAGKFMIYMQALRFLTDYLDDDQYYGQKYEGHNLVRAGNQSVLLQKLTEKENELLQGISYNEQPSIVAPLMARQA